MKKLILILCLLLWSVPVFSTGMFPTESNPVFKTTGCPKKSPCLADENDPRFPNKLSREGMLLWDALLNGQFPIEFDMTDWAVPTPKTLPQFIWSLKYTKTAEEILWPWVDVTNSGTSSFKNVRDVVEFLMEKQTTSESVAFNYVDLVLFPSAPKSVKGALISNAEQLAMSENWDTAYTLRNRGGAWGSVPTADLADGQMYFDTGLKKPFYYNTGDTTWYDAAGAAHP